MEATANLACWRSRLSELDSDLVHRAGVKHQAMAALWNLKTSGRDTKTLDNEIHTMAIFDRAIPNKSLKND